MIRKLIAVEFGFIGLIFVFAACGGADLGTLSFGGTVVGIIFGAVLIGIGKLIAGGGDRARRKKKTEDGKGYYMPEMW